MMISTAPLLNLLHALGLPSKGRLKYDSRRLIKSKVVPKDMFAAVAVDLTHRNRPTTIRIPLLVHCC